MNKNTTVKCSECETMLDPAWDMFPNGRCVKCHEKAWDEGRIERPTAEQLANQFKKAVRKF